MWIFTKIGFFSIVSNTQCQGELLVRARDENDLRSFLNWVNINEPAHAQRSMIQATPERDYPYRVSLPQTLVAQTLKELASDIDYPNFKSAVAAEQGYERAAAYHDVWDVLREKVDTRGATFSSLPAPTRKRPSRAIR